MSKTPRSSRTHSRSASRSRSGSDSRSRSRSSSQSRSRKHRYGSRSRSRSRSHSPFHDRGRKHPREYQNNREFRGYHRGFRRPYYFRGRGRGYFRGRFQRGGGFYNNYRPNNWQNFGQHPQQKQQKQHKLQQTQQQKQYAHSPKRGRSRTPKKRSNSPKSLSHSQRSDRSSSLHSHHSSSSASSRQINASAKNNCEAGIEVQSAPKESQEPEVQEGHHPEKDGSKSGEKASKTWLFPINHNSSPKSGSAHIHSAVSAVHYDLASSESGPVPENSGATSNGASFSQPVAPTPSNSSPPKKSPTTVFSGFGLFSNADQEEDTVAISIAFKKFLEEQKNKKKALGDKSMENEVDNGNALPENRNSKCEGTFDRLSCPRLYSSAVQNNKMESEKKKYVDSFKGNTSSNSFWPAILSEEEEEDGEDTKPHLKMRVVENEVPKLKSKVTMSARELFEEHFRRLDDRAWDDELEAFLINREKERAANILFALSKREKIARKFEDLSPERPSKVKRKDRMTSSPSPTFKPLSRKSSDIQEQEMFMNLVDESSPRASGKREKEFSLRMDSLSDDLARSSVLSNDWRNTMDLVHSDKGLQHRWCYNLCRSTTELFAQHVISIVHYVTAQHFPSSGMTLSDRFAMYQRLAAEKETMKARKSPEIHRRIDVSPSAFMRHSFLFDELKDSGESSSKADVKKFKGDTMDLSMNVEKRKKYLSRDTNEKKEERGESGKSESSMESSTEKSSKHHKKSKKSKKKRERSHSSSSSSSFVHEEATESTEKSSTQLQIRKCVGTSETGKTHGGFQFRIRGRGWSRVNCLGNDSKCNSNALVQSHSKNMDWDSDQMSKNKKYYLLDEKDVEGERKWVDTQGHGQSAIPRGKGRFILRRPTISITTKNSNWTHDRFKASGDGESGNRDHTEQNNA